MGRLPLVELFMALSSAQNAAATISHAPSIQAALGLRDQAAYSALLQAESNCYAGAGGTYNAENADCNLDASGASAGTCQSCSDGAHDHNYNQLDVNVNLCRLRIDRQNSMLCSPSLSR